MKQKRKGLKDDGGIGGPMCHQESIGGIKTREQRRRRGGVGEGENDFVRLNSGERRRKRTIQSRGIREVRRQNMLTSQNLRNGKGQMS